jgi:S1-C subfamily serine protease
MPVSEIAHPKVRLAACATAAVLLACPPFACGSGRTSAPRPPATNTASCFAVHPDGFVMTANHAVEGVHSITVRFLSGEQLAATLERTEPLVDLALLRVAASLPAYLPLASSAPRSGESVFALGFPRPSWSEPEYAAGTVRGRAFRFVPFLIETDFPKRPGDSGAPLVDGRGEVVGVIVSILETPDERWQGTLAVRAPDASELLGDAPETPPPAATPEEARARVNAAICELEVELGDAVEPAEDERRLIHRVRLR